MQENFVIRNNKNVTSSYIELTRDFKNCSPTVANILCQEPRFNKLIASEWSACDKPCDGGLSFRQQTQGKNFIKFESRDCNTHPCNQACIEPGYNLVVNGTMSAKQDAYECHLAGIEECKRKKIQTLCPITCKLAGCEKYWRFKDHQTYFDDFVSQDKSRNLKLDKLR